MPTAQLLVVNKVVDERIDGGAPNQSATSNLHRAKVPPLKS